MNNLKQGDVIVKRYASTGIFRYFVVGALEGNFITTKDGQWIGVMDSNKIYISVLSEV